MQCFSKSTNRLVVWQNFHDLEQSFSDRSSELQRLLSSFSRRQWGTEQDLENNKFWRRVLDERYFYFGNNAFQFGIWQIWLTKSRDYFSVITQILGYLIMSSWWRVIGGSWMQIKWCLILLSWESHLLHNTRATKYGCVQDTHRSLSSRPWRKINLNDNTW